MNSIQLKDYTYELPQERIAVYPLSQRDHSKLLVYNNGQILHKSFQSLPDCLPPHSFLFFNDTKVIPARLLFSKETGAQIEIFLLNPIQPTSVLTEAMQAIGACTWKCTIGNLKRWKHGQVLEKKFNHVTLHASLSNREEGIVTFSWDSADAFAQIITIIGETPLPPYIQRKTEDRDKQHYQTIYSHHEGAVAAPTAGLHFTDEVFHQLETRKIRHDFVTLHVSAGTFQPIKNENAALHTMHNEQIVVNKRNLENLLQFDQRVVAVGTTSLRTLESIYWFGVKLLEQPNADFEIEQDEPYQLNLKLPSSREAVENVIDYMDRHQLDTLIGNTSIYILPGYTFRICKGLITNFHQPGSTLILLVAAFIGKDWRKVYAEALENQYRFLSYGDSSLLLPG